MNITTTNGFYRLTPSTEGNFVTDGYIVSTDVCCPIESDTLKWREVTEEEANVIIAAQEEDEHKEEEEI